MKLWLTALLAMLLSLPAIAQVNGDGSEQNNRQQATSENIPALDTVPPPIVKKKLSWMDKHYLSSFTFILLWDMFEYKGQTVETPYGYKEVINNREGVSILSATYDARINLKNFNERSSISLNVPVTAGLSGITGGDGFFHMHLPLLVHYNYGYHSTYNNIDHHGFTIGAGAQLTLAPIIPEQNVNTLAFPMVIGKIGYKSSLRSMTAYDLTIGFGNGYYFKFGYGIVLNY